jgi:CheY-like chemotaxis protein
MLAHGRRLNGMKQEDLGMSRLTINKHPASEEWRTNRHDNQRKVRSFARGRGRLDVKPTITAIAERLRVLVVDDHRDGANTKAALVGLWGHAVRRAYDGATGLALAGAYRPDVLLLDVMMPNMSGIDLAPQVRRLAGLKNCLMIAVTGRTGAKTQSQCEHAGVDLIFTKPVNLESLRTLLALVSEYRMTVQCEVWKRALAAARARRRMVTSSPWRTRQPSVGLHVTVAC